MQDLTRIETMRQPVTDAYHGVEITDDYRWLEDAASEDTALWTKAQDERTRAYLRSLPGYQDILRRAGEIIAAPSTSYADLKRGGPTYFALKRRPPKQQAFLVVMDDVTDTSAERVL